MWAYKRIIFSQSVSQPQIIFNNFHKKLNPIFFVEKKNKTKTNKHKKH